MAVRKLRAEAYFFALNKYTVIGTKPTGFIVLNLQVNKNIIYVCCNIRGCVLPSFEDISESFTENPLKGEVACPTNKKTRRLYL